MRAAIIHAARDLRIETMPEPAIGAQQVAVRIRAAGICGSDLHYYLDGGFGTVRLREPMIPGHEIAGVVAAVGSEVRDVAPGERVAVNPSLPCGHCRFCLEGQAQHCVDMRFFGSAMRMPHVQGGFREILVCDHTQAVKIAGDLPLEHAVFAEPLAVVLHAKRQAGDLVGQRVLVTGCGPIGALAVLVARQAGAREVVGVDLLDEPLAVVRRLGADHVVNLAADPDGMDRFAPDKGFFDVCFEASGSGKAIANALTVVRPGGVIVQVGLAGGEVPIAINTVVAKEITLRGTFRFHHEFAWAVETLAARRIDVAPLLSEIVPLSEATRAFELAADRRRAMKVQLAI